MQFQDISERKELADASNIWWIMIFLTGLYNRRHFEQELARRLSVLRAMVPRVVFLIDIDNFKTVNDTFGIWREMICSRRLQDY